MRQRRARRSSRKSWRPSAARQEVRSRGCQDRVRHALRFSARASRLERRRDSSQASTGTGGFNRPQSERCREKHEFADFAALFYDNHGRNAGVHHETLLRGCFEYSTRDCRRRSGIGPGKIQIPTSMRRPSARLFVEFSDPGAARAAAQRMRTTGLQLWQVYRSGSRSEHPAAADARSGNGIWSAIDAERCVSARDRCRTRPLLPGPT